MMVLVGVCLESMLIIAMPYFGAFRFLGAFMVSRFAGIQAILLFFLLFWFFGVESFLVMKKAGKILFAFLSVPKRKETFFLPNNKMAEIIF